MSGLFFSSRHTVSSCPPCNQRSVENHTGLWLSRPKTSQPPLESSSSQTSPSSPPTNPASSAWNHIPSLATCLAALGEHCLSHKWSHHFRDLAFSASSTLSSADCLQHNSVKDSFTAHIWQAMPLFLESLLTLEEGSLRISDLHSNYCLVVLISSGFSSLLSLSILATLASWLRSPGPSHLITLGSFLQEPEGPIPSPASSVNSNAPLWMKAALNVVSARADNPTYLPRIPRIP